MNKNFYIVLLVVFGFLGTPNTAFSCGLNHSDKKSCKKEVSSKQKIKDCCTTKNCTNDEESSCGGKCGHSNCNIPTAQTAYFVPNLIQINAVPFSLYEEKSKFFNHETNISSGLNSIWLIPKIS